MTDLWHGAQGWQVKRRHLTVEVLQSLVVDIAPGKGITTQLKLNSLPDGLESVLHVTDHIIQAAGRLNSTVMSAKLDSRLLF